MNPAGDEWELTKAQIEELMQRLERLGGGDTWIPQWLSAVGSREEIAEWKAISKSSHGSDLYERRLRFAREMREKHPDMPLTWEEQLEEMVRKLKEDKDLARREGLIEEDI